MSLIFINEVIPLNQITNKSLAFTIKSEFDIDRIYFSPKKGKLVLSLPSTGEVNQ